jgi:D-glycero-D-manno-heptose 1,7-bisphosphate phosphatase
VNQATESTERSNGGRPHSCGRTAVFLDRDGVINDQTAFVNTPDDFRLLPGAAAAIRRLNEAGIPIVVVTNQGGIALGYLTEDDLAAIHARMAELLAAQGAHVDATYYCPHYPRPTISGQGLPMTVEGNGTPGRTAFDPRRRSWEAAPSVPHCPNPELAKYQKDCPDRKPGIGMLERARDELGIDLPKSFLVGDATTDILAGLRAGCTTILVQTGFAGSDAKAGIASPAEPDYTVADLPAAVELILAELIPWPDHP